MSRRTGIGIKITALVAGVTLISLALIGFITDTLNRRAMEERYFESLNTLLALKADRLGVFTGQIDWDMRLAASLPAVKQINLKSLEANQINTELDNFFHNMEKVYGYPGIYILDESRAVIYSSHGSDDLHSGKEQLLELTDVVFKTPAVTPAYSPPFKDKNTYFIWSGLPITLADGKAILIYKNNLNVLNQIFSDTAGLGKTGELYFIKAFSENNLVALNPLRHQPKDTYFSINNTDTLAHQAVRAKNGYGKSTDYRNQPVLAAWKYVSGLDWEMVVKIDEAEVAARTAATRNILWLTGLGVLLLCSLISLVFSNILIRPLRYLKAATDQLGKGILPAQVRRSSSDEIGDMTETINNLVSGLKETASFARQIGEGDFETSFQPLSENDTLGVSLLQMRDNLKEASNKDDEQSWIITGLAEVGDILRATNRLDELSERVTAYIVRRIQAIQGAFYVIQDENARQDKRKIIIEMTASYAFNKKKYLKARFGFAEGLVGQAVAEQDTLLRTEIPDDYMTITSGLLGDRKPTCLLVVPLLTLVGSEKEAFGVMEFAGFEKFSPRQVRFVNEVSEIIARTIFNIKVNETTRQLLQMSQKQSEELQEQQEILRQNAEEMQATQEELRRTNSELEYQIEEVNNTQKRMQLLLENASEVIIIYEKDSTVRYVSPSVEKILGYTSEEMVGTGLSARLNDESVDVAQNFFSNLLKQPDARQDMEISFNKKDGEAVWLEAIGINLFNDKAVNGIVVNIRDITERRRAEQEARRRGQMQALSENSPDLITRFNTGGRVSYINPVIETYTGFAKEHFLQKSLSEIEFNAAIVSQWQDVLKKVISGKEKVAVEMNFPSVMGDRVMQVNAIPEYNTEQALDSVLVVSHDITDRKLAELEIQSKNRKITESINYAQRIQGSILPNNAVIQHIFPQSFILYKPRDVVSGDFPWFLQKGDDCYIAAVDCTGHGVPGALISLIGYFLLNNAIRDFSEPGQILDELDKAVTHTLRQDTEDSSTRDGMDIALCKINLKTNTLQYAGAHRPLYCWQNNALLEIKGDKYPIGGGQYKARSKFQTHTLAIEKNDAVFFCSDGYPDQFGGPDNRKLSSKRVRDLIIENNAGKSMPEMYQVFDEAFETWKNGYKQTDDVLLIGIRF